MIYVTLTGNLVKDFTKSKDQKYCFNRIACKAGGRTKFFDIVLSEKSASRAEAGAAAKKGAFVELTGTVSLSSYTNKQGEDVLTETVWIDIITYKAPLPKQDEILKGADISKQDKIINDSNCFPF